MLEESWLSKTLRRSLVEQINELFQKEPESVVFTHWLLSRSSYESLPPDILNSSMTGVSSGGVWDQDSVFQISEESSVGVGGLTQESLQCLLDYATKEWISGKTNKMKWPALRIAVLLYRPTAEEVMGPLMRLVKCCSAAVGISGRTSCDVSTKNTTGAGIFNDIKGLLRLEPTEEDDPVGSPRLFIDLVCLPGAPPELLAVVSKRLSRLQPSVFFYDKVRDSQSNYPTLHRGVTVSITKVPKIVIVPSLALPDLWLVRPSPFHPRGVTLDGEGHEASEYAKIFEYVEAIGLQGEQVPCILAMGDVAASISRQIVDGRPGGQELVDESEDTIYLGPPNLLADAKFEDVLSTGTFNVLASRLSTGRDELPDKKITETRRDADVVVLHPQSTAVIFDRREDLLTPLLISETVGGLLESQLALNYVRGELLVPADSKGEHQFTSSLSRIPLDPPLLLEVLGSHPNSISEVLKTHLDLVSDTYARRGELSTVGDLKEYLPEFKSRQSLHSLLAQLIRWAGQCMAVIFKFPTFRVQRDLQLSLLKCESKSFISKASIKGMLAEQDEYMQRVVSKLSNNVSTDGPLTYLDIFEHLQWPHLSSADGLGLAAILRDVIMEEYLVATENENILEKDASFGAALQQRRMLSKMRTTPGGDALRLACLASQILGGLPRDVLGSVSELLLVLYGPQAAVWIRTLHSRGLLKLASKCPFLVQIRTSVMGLISTNNNYENDVLEDCCPPITRVIEKMLSSLQARHPALPLGLVETPLDWELIHDWLPLFEGTLLKVKRSGGPKSITENSKTPILPLFFIGGITITEYLTIRKLMTRFGLQFIIVAPYVLPQGGQLISETLRGSSVHFSVSE